MRPPSLPRIAVATILPALLLAPLAARENPSASADKGRKKTRPFAWVSPANDRATGNLPTGVRHATFKSPSMGVEVGYYLYLPPGYNDPANADRRYAVVYHLHGGRPGGEYKSVRLAALVHTAIEAGEIEPTIYVFPNGGPMSWYNMPDREQAMGESVFVTELLPHIDATWRTTGQRSGRALEGFSQGGRGTTRIMFKHPELFASVAPGGSGYEPETRIQENDGWESENLRLLPLGYNAWDLAAKYAENPKPELRILLWVGTEGFNYQFNLKFSRYLDELGIPHKMLVVEGVDHSAIRIYEKKGLELMQFHQQNFARGK
ncbi:MAG: alpha/beta hydrolase [Verrucomicrobiales bacterium]